MSQVDNPVDISDELRIIEKDPRGKAVKDAIYDALVKLNNAKSAPAPSPTPLPGQIGEAEVINRLTSFYDEAPGIGGVVRNIPLVTYTGWTWRQETDDTVKETATLTANPSAPCLLVAAFMHRDETVSISGDGWTKIATSQGAYGTAYQWMTVWTKRVIAGTYPVTISQSSEARCSMKLIVLYGASSLTLVDNDLLATVPYTPSGKNGKRRLYVLSSYYASTTSNPPNAITVSYSGIDLRSAEELRFSVFYDYEPDVNTVPSFSYFSPQQYITNLMNALVFDIEEV